MRGWVTLVLYCAGQQFSRFLGTYILESNNCLLVLHSSSILPPPPFPFLSLVSIWVECLKTNHPLHVLTFLHVSLSLSYHICSLAFSAYILYNPAISGSSGNLQEMYDVCPWIYWNMTGIFKVVKWFLVKDQKAMGCTIWSLSLFFSIIPLGPESCFQGISFYQVKSPDL